MFSEMILKITNYVYWDFLSTLSAMLLGIFLLGYFQSITIVRQTNTLED